MAAHAQRLTSTQERFDVGIGHSTHKNEYRHGQLYDLQPAMIRHTFSELVYVKRGVIKET